MSESAEERLIEMFDSRLAEIYSSYKNLRRWTYAFITIFGISMLSAMYWAGKISANVERITQQVDRIEAKNTDMVFFLAREMKYNPSVRGSDNANDKE